MTSYIAESYQILTIKEFQRRKRDHDDNNFTTFRQRIQGGNLAIWRKKLGLVYNVQLHKMSDRSRGTKLVIFRQTTQKKNCVGKSIT